MNDFNILTPPRGHVRHITIIDQPEVSYRQRQGSRFFSYFALIVFFIFLFFSRSNDERKGELIAKKESSSLERYHR